MTAQCTCAAAVGTGIIRSKKVHVLWLAEQFPRSAEVLLLSGVGFIWVMQSTFGELCHRSNLCSDPEHIKMGAASPFSKRCVRVFDGLTKCLRHTPVDMRARHTRCSLKSVLVHSSPVTVAGERHLQTSPVRGWTEPGSELQSGCAMEARHRHTWAAHVGTQVCQQYLCERFKVVVGPWELCPSCPANTPTPTPSAL